MSYVAVNHQKTAGRYWSGSQAIGEASSDIIKTSGEAVKQYCDTISFFEARFTKLKNKWKEETLFLSSLNDIYSHPAYQEIISMGVMVLPFLLRDLEEKPDLWFYALKKITGEDPVSPENRGSIRKMAEEWLSWAQQSGLN